MIYCGAEVSGVESLQIKSQTCDGCANHNAVHLGLKGSVIHCHRTGQVKSYKGVFDADQSQFDDCARTVNTLSGVTPPWLPDEPFWQKGKPTILLTQSQIRE